MAKTGEMRAKVVALRKQGLRHRAIAERLGITENTVLTHLRLAGATRMAGALSPFKLSVKARLMQGMSSSDIARELGVSKQRISQVISDVDRAFFNIRVGGHWKAFSPEILDAAWARVLAGELMSSIEKDFGGGIGAALRRSGRYPNKTQARRVMSDAKCAEIDQRIKEHGETSAVIAAELGISRQHVLNSLSRWRKRKHIVPVKARKDDPRRKDTQP